ncbi:phosphatidate cytidylyltransferase, partial [Chloroflexota bacterium]
LIWLLIRRQREGAFRDWSWTIAGILYVGWLLSYLVALRGVAAGRDWVFLALFTIFASDISAFFVGRAWGKHRLAPSISPRKTWEGAVAGVLGAVVISLVVVKLSGLPLSFPQAILLGILVGILGQLGDLVESLFKRNTGVKESGKLMPGHGGVLDRIDSVVFAGVVVYYYTLAYHAGWLNWLQW